MKTTKNFCSMKNEDAVDHSSVTKWFKKFWKDFDDHSMRLSQKFCNILICANLHDVYYVTKRV